MENNTQPKELSLDEVQSSALEVYKKISEICERMGLRYWLAYGTALGAVRHGGFIPWDDDLDIYMPRIDLEILLRYFERNAAEMYPLVVVTPAKGKKVPFLITRISDERFIMRGEFGDEIRLGAFIDIYPLDGVGNSLNEAQDCCQEAAKIMKSYARSIDSPYMNKNISKFQRMAKRAYCFIKRELPDRELEKMSRLLEKYSYEESDYISVAVWNVSKIEIFSKLDFEQSIPCTFSGERAFLPSGFNRILTSEYGDYMTLPPESDRVGHHFYNLFRVSPEN